MLRWLSFFGAVALVAAGVVFYVYKGPPRPLIDPPRPDQPIAKPDEKVALANPRPAEPAGPWTREVGIVPLVVIPGARLTARHSPQVPSMRDGQLLFLGTEIQLKSGENPPPGAFKAEMPYLITEAHRGDLKPGEGPPADWVARGDKWYRPLAKREDVRPNTVRLDYAERWFVPVDEGSKVREGQLMGMIDPALAVDDLSIRLAKLDAAEADRQAAEKTRDEAKKRWDRTERLYKAGAESIESVDAAQLGYYRYVFETVSKTEAVKTAGKELRQAETILDLHMIRSKINGQVKQLSKHKGESVKNLDTVLEMQDHSKLRIRGQVGLQDLRTLQQSPALDVEATRHVGPTLVLTGHMGEVTGVAVSKDKQVVSASEDGTVRVWDKNLASLSERLVLERLPAVRAVACTSKDAPDNLCLIGGADGIARVFDLDPAAKGNPSVRDLLDANGHKEAINGVAFSPDGRWAATGGDDRAICLWDVRSGKLLHRFPADRGHRGGVTSVQFLPDADKKALSLVSAGRDNALIVWPLAADGAPQPPKRFDRRGGEVTTLGVNPKGGQVLFDQGKELRLLSPDNGALAGTLSATGAANFTKLALFSPDGNLVLASGGAGRLHLWRAPTAERRGHELEQLMWTSGKDEQAITTSGAFAPDGSFLVTGAQNRVIVWPMPGKEDVENRLTAHVVNLDPEVSSGLVRITAELDNPGYLLPGDGVTLVVYPPKK